MSSRTYNVKAATVDSDINVHYHDVEVQVIDGDPFLYLLGGLPTDQKVIGINVPKEVMSDLNRQQ